MITTASEHQVDKVEQIDVYKRQEYGFCAECVCNDG